MLCSSNKMKKAANLLISSVVLMAFLLTFSSCSKDEKKKKETAKVSFDITIQTVGEDEGSIFIPYQIEDGPIADDATLSFDLSGTATLDEDYEFFGWDEDGVYLTLIDDDIFESDETIVVSITEGNKVDISSPNTHTATITNNDPVPGLQIDLTWDDGATGDVDMDILVWRETAPGSVDFEPLDEYFADAISFSSPESTFIPATENDGIYAISYTYYEGSNNSLDFDVTISSVGGTINGAGSSTSFSGTYTLANINEWDVTQTAYLAQFYEKVGTNYVSLTGIDIPSSGSRIKPFNISSVKSKQEPVSKKVTVRKSRHLELKR